MDKETIEKKISELEKEEEKLEEKLIDAVLKGFNSKARRIRRDLSQINKNLGLLYEKW